VLAGAGLNRLFRANERNYEEEEDENCAAIASMRHPIPFDVMLPGACQGIVAAVTRRRPATPVASGSSSYDVKQQLLMHVLDNADADDQNAAIAAAAERAFLDSLDESSPWKGRPPLAGFMSPVLGEPHGDTASACFSEWEFHGLLARPDGKRVLRESERLSLGAVSARDRDNLSFLLEHAKQLGRTVGLKLLSRSGRNFYDPLK